MLIQRFLDQMNIYLGLTTRRNAVEQYDRFLEKLKDNLIISVLLWLAERLDRFELRLAPPR